MWTTHTLESGDDLFPHKPYQQKRHVRKTVITTENAKTCLAHELPGDAVRLDLDFQTCIISPSPQVPAPAVAQMAKSPRKVYAP